MKNVKVKVQNRRWGTTSSIHQGRELHVNLCMNSWKIAWYSRWCTLFCLHATNITRKLSFLIKRNTHFIETWRFKKTFASRNKFFTYDIEKFILLFWTVIYPYECMDDWKKLKETSLPEKEDFFSHPDMEDITTADYAHAKNVCKYFKIKT